MELEQDRVFAALTRPQMFAGVTYSWFVANAVVSAEIFLILKSAWVILPAFALHAMAYVACLHEPRVFDLWITKLIHCAKVPNFAAWGCNSYRP